MPNQPTTPTLQFLILSVCLCFSTILYAQEIDSGLVKQLEQIHEDDQSLRRQIDIVQTNYGHDSRQMEELGKKIHKQDSLNLIKVERIIKKHGYPGKSLVGNEHSSTAFLVIQHSDLATQEKYLPMLKEAAEAGELPYSSLALLIDRVRMRHKIPQLYGTQLYRNPETGNVEFYEILDESCVDQRRKEVGLPPLKEYAKWFDIKYKRPGKCKKKKEKASN